MNAKELKKAFAVAEEINRYGTLEKRLPPGTKLPVYSGPAVEFISEPTWEDRQRQHDLLRRHFTI